VHINAAKAWQRKHLRGQDQPVGGNDQNIWCSLFQQL
jgi:hypothetical protein